MLPTINGDGFNSVVMTDDPMGEGNVRDQGQQEEMANSSSGSESATFRVYLNEFVFTEYEYVEVKKQKTYRKTNVKSCGWFKKKKAGNPFLDNSDVRIPLDPLGEYFIEKLLILQICSSKIPKRFYLERTVPEFLVVSSGSLHIGAKLKKLAAINANQHTLNRILNISSFIQNRLIQEWPENLREDVILFPFVTTKNRSCRDISLDGILQLDVLEQFFSNAHSLLEDPSFQRKLAIPRGLLARCEQTFDYSILTGVNEKRQLLGNKLVKDVLRKALSDPGLLSAKTADIVIDPDFVSFPNYGLEFFEQLREQFKLVLYTTEQMNHYEKLLDFYHGKYPHYSFARDPLLLRIAHTFTSYSHKMNFGRCHYERLEFMGDSIVNLTAGTELINSCRNDDTKKGDWNAAYTVLIANDSIVRVADKLQISEYFLNTAATVSKKGPSNVIESLIGGLHMSGGIKDAISFTKELLIPASIDFKCIRKFSSSFPSVPSEGEQWKRDAEHTNLFIRQEVIDSIQNILQYRFKNIELLQEALISCTYNNTFIDLRQVPLTEKISKFLKKRNDNKIVGMYHLYNNEQLKLLGSTLLKFLVTEFVYKRFTEAQPNKLTLLAHQIISKQGSVFTTIHEKKKLYQFLMKGEDSSEYPELHQSYDCFVALLGAIYIDQGCTLYQFKLDSVVSEDYKEELANSTDPCCIHFLKRHDITPDSFFYSFFFPYVEQFKLSPYTVEAPRKHQLQHLIQVNLKSAPKYEKKQDFAQSEGEFCVTILVDEQELSKGFSSKSFAEAEELAIENGMKKLESLMQIN